MRKVIIMGAGGRDFHNFNVAFRDDPDTEVVAFTATQIPGIDERIYPASLAGPRYPNGIPIRPEEVLHELIREFDVDEVILSYSDLKHETVMHKASIVLAAGADFRLMGPDATMLHSSKPVVAVCATRTGCGKSQTSRKVGQALLGAGLKVALVRHPMPYGDLEAMRVQRFATLEEIDASHPTVEEREEYEEPVRMGMVMYAGVDYEAILRAAEQEADVVIWDGGNNDFPFFAPDLLIVVADPLRPGHELLYHPGETNLRMADVVVINKVDSAEAHNVEQVVENVEAVNPMATLVFAKSPPKLDDGPDLLRQARPGRRRRPDADPRRDAVRRRSGRRPQRGRSEDRRSAALRRRLAEAGVREVAAADERAAGDGLLGRAAPRAGADDQCCRLRRRRHRHTDRPDTTDRVASSDPPRAVRARGGRHADHRHGTRADRHTGDGCSSRDRGRGVMAMSATTTGVSKGVGATRAHSLPRNFTRVADLTPEELRELLDLATAMKSDAAHADDALRGQSIACIFEKPSTRTRVSFASAIARLGATPVALSPQELQLGRGESIADTARSLSGYVAAIVIRTFAQETVDELAWWATVPVVNALSDKHHPCQALADLLTIEEIVRRHRRAPSRLRRRRRRQRRPLATRDRGTRRP